MNENYKELYSYLKDNGLTDLDETSFFNVYSSNESKFNELYSYLKGKGMTDLSSNDFKNKYLSSQIQPKKKEDGGLLQEAQRTIQQYSQSLSPSQESESQQLSPSVSSLVEPYKEQKVKKLSPVGTTIPAIDYTTMQEDLSWQDKTGVSQSSINQNKIESEEKAKELAILEEKRRKKEAADDITRAREMFARRAEEEKIRLENEKLNLDYRTKDLNFLSNLNSVTSDLISTTEENVVQKLNEKFKGNGIVFEEAGWGTNRIIARTEDGKSVINIGSYNFLDSANTSEAEKLRNFISKNAKRTEDIGDRDFLSNSLKAQNLRAVPMIENGEPSTVRFTSFEEDGKFLVIPTLFPKDPNKYTTNPSTWMELPFEQARKVAMERGEVFTFKTQKEADDFAKGSWKDVNTIDIEGDSFFKALGKDYMTEKKRYERFTELDDIIDFAEKVYKYEGTSMTEQELQKKYPKYFISGKARFDLEKMLPEMKKERDALKPLVKDYTFFNQEGTSEDARMMWDKYLQDRNNQISSQAAAVNRDAKIQEMNLDKKSYEKFGVSIKDLKNYAVTNPSQKKEYDQLINQYVDAQDKKVIASEYMQEAKLYFDAKDNKNIMQEFSENFSGVVNSTLDAYRENAGGAALLNFAIGLKNASKIKDVKEASEYIKNLRESMSGTQSKELTRFQNVSDFSELIDVISDDPISVITSLVGSSFATQLPVGTKIIPATVLTSTAYGGATAGLPGAVGGFFSGLSTGQAITEFATEYNTALIDAIKKRGYDMEDPYSLQKALLNKEVWDEALEIGVTRGIPMAIMEKVTGGLSGRVFVPSSRLATTASKLKGYALESAVIDPTSEMLGELAAQGAMVATGKQDKIQYTELYGEFLGGLGAKSMTNGASTLYKIVRDHNNINLAYDLTDVANIAKENVSDERIMSWADNMVRLGKIDNTVAHRIRENVGLKREAKELMSVGEKPSNEVVARTMELMAAKQELTKTKNRSEVYRDKISEIDEELANMASTKKVADKDNQTSLVGITEAVRPSVAEYTINNRRYTKERFLDKINSMSPSRISRNDVKVVGDEEVVNLLNKKTNAVQEQTAGQVSVQPTTGVSQEVAQGESQTESQVTTGQGVTEEKPKEKISVYRGIGNNVMGSDNSSTLWVAEDKEVAKNYAGTLEDGTLNVQSLEVEKPSNPIEMPYKLATDVRGSDIANNLRSVVAKLKKSGELPKENISKVLELISDFESKAGDNLELFTAKLNKTEANEAFSKAVQALGFDGIIQKESAARGGEMTNTYGIFKNKYSSLLQPTSETKVVDATPTIAEVAPTERTPEQEADLLEELVSGKKTTPTETTETKVEFTDQDRNRKRVLEDGLKYSDKRRKTVLIGGVTMTRSEANAELDALKQKEKTSINTIERTADEEADLLEELVSGKKREKDSKGDARARLSMAENQMPDNRNNEDSIVEEMNKMASYEVDFQEPSPSDTKKEVDPIKESFSIFKSIEKLIDFLKGNKKDKYFKKNKYNLLRKIQDFNGIPMMLGMSDILASGIILDSMGGEMTVGGGILFNVFGGNENAQENIDKAWAGVNENGADNQYKNALKVYEANKDLFERLWEEGRLPYGQIPMAIMRMANTAINSNEAVFRYVLPYLKSLPIKNRKDALKSLLESINKKKENDSGSNWMEEFSNKINDGTIQSKEDAIAYLNNMIDETNVKATKNSIKSFITTITPNKVDFSGENSIVEKINKKQERVNAYIVYKFIQDNNIDTIDGFFDAIVKDAESRSKDGNSKLALPQRSYIFNQLFSKEGVETPNTQIIKDLFDGIKNPRKELFTSTHIYNAIGEKSMLKANQGEVVAIMGINVKENTGISKAKHKNYGWGPNGSIIALIKNPMHGIDVFPEFRAKASRMFKVKKKEALTSKELSRMEAIEKALDGIDKNTTTITVDGNEISVKDAKKELAKYVKQQTVELPKMEAVAQQTGGAFFMDKAFIGATARAEDIKMIDMLIGKLRYAFPGVSVTYTQEEFDSFMNQEGSKIKQSKDGLIIYGVTKDGKIFLNPAAQSLRTPIHEFGHIWIDFLRSNASGKKGDALLKKGFELVKDTPEHKHAIELYGDGEIALEEALVELIATKGETLIKAADRSNFKSWLNAVFKYIQEKFKGFKVITQVGIKDMSLDDFINVALSDLFGGNEISSKFDAAKESSADYRYSLTQDIYKAIEIARINGYSEDGIKTFLKRRGLDDAKINELLNKSIAAKGKIELSEETLPGYTKLMNRIKDVIKRSRSRGLSENQIMENVIANVESRSPEYANATDQQREQIIRDIRKMFGKKEKAAPSAKKILGINFSNKLTIEERVLRDLQIKAEIRGAKNVVAKMKLMKQYINSVVRDWSKGVKGKVSLAQMKNIISKLNKTNLLDDGSINKFIDYMFNVINDAEYGNKLSQANSNIKEIKTKIKNLKEIKSPILKELAKQFSKLDPSLVEDIDLFNSIANNILDNLSKNTVADVINYQDLSLWLAENRNKQEEIKKARLVPIIEDITGQDAKDLTYDQMIEILESLKEKSTEKDETEIREKLQEAFDNAVIAYQEKNPIVDRFINIDLSKLSVSEIVEVVYALANYIENKDTAKMETIISMYEGNQSAESVSKKNLKISKFRAFSRFMNEQFAALPILFEKLFNGVKRGMYVMDMMGLSTLINSSNEAKNIFNGIVADYVSKFYSQNPNSQEFNTLYNNVERGMLAALLRSPVGNIDAIKKDFERNRGLILDAIEKLSRGDDNQVKIAQIYQQVYDKILKDSKDATEVLSKVDPINAEAVNWWINQWSDVYDEMYDVSLNVYNKQLDKDYNYTSSKFSFINLQEDIIEDDMSSYDYATGSSKMYEKMAGNLMKAIKPTSRNLNKGMYLDLNFDTVNANAMSSVLVDIKTAASIKKVKGFVESKYFPLVIPDANMRAVITKRINDYIKNIRKKRPYDSDEFGKVINLLETIAKYATSQALGGVTQPIKQIFPGMLNTITQTGDLSFIVKVFNSDVHKFLNESGYGISNRGVEASAQLESINKMIEIAAQDQPSKVIKKIGDINDMMLKALLVKPDIFIARASWIAYYEQYMRKNNKGQKINYATHKINKEAADYAEIMTSRQLNLNDADLAGSFFLSNDTGKKWIRNTLLPFANFRINQYLRTASDVSRIVNFKTTSKEDRVIAIRSLVGTIAETVLYKSIAVGIGLGLTGLSMAVRGEDDEEEWERAYSNAIKGSATSAVTDFLSPIPLTDQFVRGGVGEFIDQVQALNDVPVEDRWNIFTKDELDVLDTYGKLGIPFKRVFEIKDGAELVLTGKFEDKYGNVKYITDQDREILLYGVLGGAFVNVFGLGVGPEYNNTYNKIVKQAKRDAQTEKQIEKKIMLGDWETKEDMKRYAPEEYEKKFGKGGVYYEESKSDSEEKKKEKEEERKEKDEEYNYEEKPESLYKPKNKIYKPKKIKFYKPKR